MGLHCILEWSRGSHRRGSLGWRAPGGDVAGGAESAAFLQQNELIRQSWGKWVVPVCETLPGLNHFSILDALTQPGHRLQQLARGLLFGNKSPVIAVPGSGPA